MICSNVRLALAASTSNALEQGLKETRRAGNAKIARMLAGNHPSNRALLALKL
jgi:hypothetical protein